MDYFLWYLAEAATHGNGYGNGYGNVYGDGYGYDSEQDPQLF